ncbi:Bloom syndrome protein-like protein [Apiospora saccharicola]
MDPFIFLEEYHLFICTACQHGCLSARKDIEHAVRQISTAFTCQSDLVALSRPPPDTNPFSVLAPPRTDGYACTTCPCVFTHLKSIQKHCRTEHGWVNKWEKGGNVRLQAADRDRTQHRPWRTGVHCQRFFPGRAGSFYFEVATTAPPPVQDTILEAFQAQATEFTRTTASVIDTGHKHEPNPWLARTGWATHLQGYDHIRLRTAVGLKPTEGWPPTTDPSDSLVLQEVFGSIDRLVRRAQALASPSSVPQPVLFLLHQRNRDQKPSTPFSGQMEDATRTTYSNIWKQVIGYFFRTEVWEPGTVPPYKLSTAQENAINDIEVFFESQTAPLPLPDKAYPDLDVRCLTLFLSIFDHELSGSPYDSLLLSALSVLGLRPTGETVTWLPPYEYTRIYSAVIKIGRLFLLLQSYDESNSEDPKSPSLYSVVRTKVFRYFTVVSAESQPSPIDFIFEARAYGIAIASGTASSADIQWEGQKVMYGKVSFTMPQFIQFVQNLTSELRRTMLSLLFIEDGSDLPSVPLTGLQDDLTDFRPEYSFLVDPRNICFTSCTGPDWLVQRITRQKSLCTAWFNGETIQPRVLEEYADLVDRFRTTLLLLMHIAGGQPARATEILSIRHRNTSYGGCRNIFISKGLVCFMTLYHKGARSKQNVKIIHRYLPDEIGADLVRYLWLVLPFWENALGIAGRGSIRSSFLFSKELVRKEDVVRGQTGSASEGLWDSDRMRRLLEAASLRLLGVKLNIHDYRHIVIAISRQFLQGAFKESTASYDGSSHDSDSEEDSFSAVYARQAAHSVQTDGMIYARTKDTPFRTTMSHQEQERTISVDWHRWLTFPSATESGEYFDGPYERLQDDASLQRIQALRRINMPAMLRTTIVVVPLVALQEDLQGRCTKLGITSWIYSYEGMQHAQVVLVTPESAGTKTFHEYVRRLVSFRLLDRVVLDEAHMVLDGSYQFRPDLQKIGRTTIEFGVPLLFLTATLAVPDIPAFIQSTGIDLRRTTIFRSSTVRANLRYSVTWVDQTDGEVPEAVRQIQVVSTSSSIPRILTYCFSRPRSEAVGKLLRCPVYHARIGTKEEKSAIVRKWVEQGGCIVSTNALGVGLDIADVRYVFHIGIPRLLRDFVQESGRAGRDGQRAESHIVGARPSTRTSRPASIIGREDIWDYMDGTGGCRRVSLDRVMDGDLSRRRCGPDEEACDLCRTEEEAKLKRKRSDSDDAELLAVSQARRHGVEWQQAVVRREKRDDQEQVERFRYTVRRLRGFCAYCRTGGGGVT